MSGKIYNGDTRVKVFFGDTKIKHVYAGDTQVYSSGSTVTYWVGPNTSYTEEVDEGASCLSPKSFTPTMSGWTFHGWREDTTASATVLSTKIMGDTPVTLYAVFKKTVTVSYNGNSSTGGSTTASTGTAYKNAMGNTANASITIRANGYTRTNYTFYRWETSSGTVYKPGNTYSSLNDLTLYAQWIVTTVNFGYTGGVQTFAAKAGVTYQLKVWGAQGGNCGREILVSGGKGGYAQGNLSIASNTTLYVVVGGQGASANNGGGGGYNGGGLASEGGDSSFTYGGRTAGGGGATHIGKSNAVLASTAKTNLYIVAGGGGGASSAANVSLNDAGGYGGGTSGGNGSTSGGNGTQGKGGTQSAGGSGIGAGSYGQGGSGNGNGSGGGGGYYGGGGARGEPWSNSYSGGGGSGYTGGVTSGSMTNDQQSGNGKAQIVVVSVS